VIADAHKDNGADDSGVIDVIVAGADKDEVRIAR
jgi:hypothetical protein